MGHQAITLDVIETKVIEEYSKEHLEILETILEEMDISIEDFAKDNYCDCNDTDFGRANKAYKDLKQDFMCKTNIDIELAYHENEDRYDEIEGAFFFGSVNQIINKSSNKLNTKVMIFNYTSVPFMDLSAIFAMEDIIKNLNKQGCKTIMILHSKKMKSRLLKMGIGNLIGEENLFLNKDDAISQSKKLLKKAEATQQ